MPEPPRIPKIVFGDCEEWTVCLDLDGALALERFLMESRSWMLESWEGCGKL